MRILPRRRGDAWLEEGTARDGRQGKGIGKARRETGYINRVLRLSDE